MESEMVPINTEIPKGLLKVRGDILIERLIRQLHEVGVDEIIVVVGYMKESLSTSSMHMEQHLL